MHHGPPTHHKTKSALVGSLQKKSLYQEDLLHFNFQKEETTVDQLEKVMISLFQMLSIKVDPILADEEAKIELETYKSQSMSLLQQLKKNETLSLRNKINQDVMQSYQDPKTQDLSSAISQVKLAPSFQTPSKQ